MSSPDPERGEVVKAYVVLHEGHAPSEALIADIQRHVKESTAPYKYPRKIEFVELAQEPLGQVAASRAARSRVRCRTLVTQVNGAMPCAWKAGRLQRRAYHASRFDSAGRSISRLYQRNAARPSGISPMLNALPPR